MTTPNTASKLTWPDDRSLKSAARLPVERSRASSAEDAANDGRPRRARSSEPRGGFAEGPKLALTLEEAAAELSVSDCETTIRRMITQGGLRSHPTGAPEMVRESISSCNNVVESSSKAAALATAQLLSPTCSTAATVS